MSDGRDRIYVFVRMPCPACKDKSWEDKALCTHMDGRGGECHGGSFDSWVEIGELARMFWQSMRASLS